jgi:hypothetical protein
MPKLYLGKVDYNGSGRRNCKAYLKWDLTEFGRFTASGEIWNPSETDCYACGQIVDTVADFFPNREQVKRIRAVWENWHLNDMKAGSPAQEAWLKENPVSVKYPESHYVKASEALKNAGLNPDASFVRNGEPYRYGSAWIKSELPQEIIEEIKSWG